MFIAAVKDVVANAVTNSLKHWPDEKDEVIDAHVHWVLGPTAGNACGTETAWFSDIVARVQWNSYYQALEDNINWLSKQAPGKRVRWNRSLPLACRLQETHLFFTCSLGAVAARSFGA